MTHSVYIRGKAVHCALGNRIDMVVQGLRQLRQPIEDISLSRINMDYTRPYYRLWDGDADLPSDARALFYQVLFHTVEAAIADAGLNEEDIARLPIFFGSTSIDIPLFEASYEHASHLLSQTSSGYGNTAHELAQHIGSRGGCYTFTTACTSSGNGLLYAANMIAQGITERALVVGYDLFSNVGFYGFEALKLITSPPYRPFDKERMGIIMGEGCGAVILDRSSGTSEDFQCLGGANTCDIHSVTTHDPEGKAIAAIMGQALHNAGVSQDEVDVVKAHATGSYHNDLTESNGLKRVFRNKLPPVTGLKPFIGHTVGACGVIELIVLTEAVKSGFVPPIPDFEQEDEELGITPLTTPLEFSRGTFLLNYFGFGGNCVSLVVSNVYS